MKRRGFTLVELLVVLAMILILVSAMTASVNSARRRAREAKALQEMKELTNAILAFEQYAPNRTLDGFETGGWKACDEKSLAMVLGGLAGDSGESVPVLYAASLTGGKMLDPWNTPYKISIKAGETLKLTKTMSNVKTGYFLPNFYRLLDEERE